MILEKNSPTRSAARRSGTRRSRETRQRIVQRSILLFNRNGLRDVAIEYIAADLDISPGLFTYHFPRKSLLIAATIDVMREKLSVALEPPTEVLPPAAAVEYLLRLYRTLWDYRFFFNSLTHILADPKLRREYNAFRSWALSTMESDLVSLSAHGYYLQPEAPNTFALLSENMWALWLNWLRMQQILNPLARTPREAALYDCALHNWSLCQAWMRRDYARDLLKAFREALPAGALAEERAASRVAKAR